MKWRQKKSYTSISKSSTATVHFSLHISLVKKSLVLRISEVLSAWSYSQWDPQELCSVGSLLLCLLLGNSCDVMVSGQLDDGLSAEDIVDEELEEQQEAQNEAVTDAQMHTLLRPSHQLTTQHTQISEHTEDRETETGIVSLGQAEKHFIAWMHEKVIRSFKGVANLFFLNTYCNITNWLFTECYHDYYRDGSIHLLHLFI